MVACRWLVPPYDERYTGYGRNKVSHIRRMALQNLSFRVLPEVYLLHQPHTASSASDEFFRSERARLQEIVALDEHLAAIARCNPFAATAAYFPTFAALRPADTRHGLGPTRGSWPSGVEDAVVEALSRIGWGGDGGAVIGTSMQGRVGMGAELQRQREGEGVLGWTHSALRSLFYCKWVPGCRQGVCEASCPAGQGYARNALAVAFSARVH